VGKVVTFRRTLLQHHLPHVHWYDTLPSIVHICCSHFGRLGLRGEQSSQGQGLDHRESGDSQVVEREPADGAKLTEDKCGQAQDRAHL
jgi:hypothetical protein